MIQRNVFKDSLNELFAEIVFVLLFLVSCCNSNSETNKKKQQLPTGTPVANFRVNNYYELVKYEDEDAICYFIERSEAGALSCIPKPKQ